MSVKFSFYNRLGLQDISSELGPLVLRLALGTIMAVHGYLKFSGGVDNVALFFGILNIPMPGLMAWFITLLEMIGGILLVMGAATRLLGFLFAGDMAVAIITVHLKNGLTATNGFEFPLALLAGHLCLMLIGGGKFSVDHVRKLKK